MDNNNGNVVAEPKRVKRHAKELQKKSRKHTVYPVDPANGVYRVVSGGSGKEYRVIVFGEGVEGRANCNCDWGTKRVETLIENKGGVTCSHTISVFEFIAEGKGRTVSAWADEDSAKRQHKPVQEVTDGVLLTSRPLPRRRVQADFFWMVK